MRSSRGGGGKCSPASWRGHGFITPIFSAIATSSAPARTCRERWQSCDDERREGAELGQLIFLSCFWRPRMARPRGNGFSAWERWGTRVSLAPRRLVCLAAEDETVRVFRGFLALKSLIVALAVLALWGRSYFTGDLVRKGSEAQYVELGSAAGST